MSAKSRIAILVLSIPMACSAPEVPADELTVIDGITYRQGSDEPFTGRSVTYYDNGQLENRTDYKGGKKDGVSEWYWRNGKLGQRAILRDGKKNGPLEAYYENGELSLRTIYEDGVRID